jgi:predicted metal-dependent enzyme (double-stranded beta helix superfamily)
MVFRREEKVMGHTLEQFATKCRDYIKAEPGPAGRRKVAALLQEVLQDKAFIDTHVDPNVGERKILYEDPEFGFCILAHDYKDAKTSPPHDHAHSWAIYGQARGETHMRDYQLLEPATADKPGKVKETRSYKLTPGVAHVYNEGDLHSPKREGPTSLIRIEGANMAKIKRLKYEPV